MFRGSSFHRIDSKGRIIIPTRFRDLIISGENGSMMISKLDGGLVAYTIDEWTKIENKILSMAEKSENMRRFRRVFIGGAFECSADKQGRILIPPALREYADLKKEIALVGVLDHFEIWSRESWDRENLEIENDYKKEEAFRNEIASLGL